MQPVSMYGYVFLLPALSAVASLTILGIAYLHNKNKEATGTLLTFLVFVLLYLTGNVIVSSVCSTDQAVLASRLLYLTLSFVPPVLYHVVALHSKRVNSQFLYSGYAASIIFTIMLWSPSFVSGMYSYPLGCFATAGVLHHIFSMFCALYLGASFYTVGKAKKFTEPYHGTHALSPVSVLLLAVTCILVLALALAYGIDTLMPLYTLVPLFSALLVLTVLRQSRFQLRIVAIQTFVVYVAIASFIQIFMVESTALRIMSTIVSTFVIMFGILVTHNTLIELEMRNKGERLAKYLANANTRLRNLDQQKTEFVSIASHQLRGPIATITGYTSMIQEGSYGSVPEKLHEPLARIFESGKRIGIMVDDFLNVTRIEQGLMLYRKSAIDINTILHTVVEEQRPIAEKRGLKISYTPCTENKIVIQADEIKIALVFQNILDNAIKFTPKGSISVSLQESDKHDRIFITFTDTGVGISQDEIDDLFMKFNRASNANTASVYGAGLGLYIAREIIKAHDGWIHVSSGGLGHGATITIELPVRQSASIHTQ